MFVEDKPQNLGKAESELCNWGLGLIFSGYTKEIRARAFSALDASPFPCASASDAVLGGLWADQNCLLCVIDDPTSGRTS